MNGRKDTMKDYFEKQYSQSKGFFEKKEIIKKKL
jgi:hypothetical protein